MTDLIAVLSTGKGTWGHVYKLIETGQWDGIYLVTNEFGKENFITKDKKIEFIVVDFRKNLIDLRDDIKERIKDKLKIEVSLNIASGTGKEHMALMAALLKLGVGIRLIALTKDGIKEI